MSGVEKVDVARWSSGLGRWPFKPEIAGSIPVRATNILRGEVLLCLEFLVQADSFFFGRVAQLVRAPALQAGGRRFESVLVHH